MPQLFSLPADWHDPVLTRAEAETLLAQSGHLLLAEPEGGHLLGMALAGGTADIITLYVPEARRRQGVARHLLTEFMETAEALGAVGLTLEVRADNTAAIALYQSFGLREVGRRKGYYDSNGPDGVDALVLACQFT
jgi:ribosomal-protein-alanine N-acetyltransferase